MSYIWKWLVVLTSITAIYSLEASANEANRAPDENEVVVQKNVNYPAINESKCSICKKEEPSGCRLMKMVPLPPCLAPCQESCCPEMTVYNHNINPPARRNCYDNEFIFSIEFLWWVANEADLPYAFVNSSTVETTTAFSPIPEVGYDENIKYEWKPALRLATGWALPYDGWEVYADWLWYRNKSSSSISSLLYSGVAPNTALYSFGVHLPTIFYTSTATGGATLKQIADIPYNSATGTYRILLNLFNLCLSKAYYISCGFSMKPYLAATGGWIDRRFSIAIGNAADATIAAAGSLAAALQQGTYFAKSNYWGIGPRLGIDTSWEVGLGIELLGKMSSALLFGKTFNNYESITSGTITGTGNQYFYISNNLHNWRMVPQLQLYTGIGWGSCFDCRKYYFGINAGWEANFFWNLANFVPPTGNTQGYTKSHNIDLCGLTIDARFDF